jgi:hypothetical protein
LGIVREKKSISRVVEFNTIVKCPVQLLATIVEKINKGLTFKSICK